MYDSRNGFYTNEFNNSSFDDQYSITGNYYLKYIANSKWAITLNVKHHNIRNDGAFPLVVPEELDSAFVNPFVLNQNGITKMVDDIYNGSLSINYFGNAFNFSSQTSYQSDHRYYTQPIDGDFSPYDIVSLINNYDGWNKVQVYTQEFKFTSSASTLSRLKWTGGCYFFYQDNPVKQATHFGENGDFFGAPVNTSIFTTTEGKTNGAAAYGQLTYSITSKIDLIGGLRFDYEKKKYAVLGEFQKDPDPTIYITRPDTSASTDFNALSPKLGIAYGVTDNNNIYASYTRGYRTGGLTQLSSDPSQPPLYPYNPEFSDNIEAGIKNNLFNNRAYLNITGFITYITDAQVPTFVLPEAITVIRNAGKLKSSGVEAEIAANPFKGLQLEYSFGFTDAKFTKLDLSQNGAEVDLSGKKQVFTPEITSSLALQYSYDLGASQQIKLVLRGEWMHLGKHYFDLSNNISQEPYDLLNTRCGIAAKNFELMFWGRNLNDTKYISYAFDFGAIHLGDPKTYGVTLTGKF
jgi:iron complex outermembrane receptor protein